MGRLHGKIAKVPKHFGDLLGQQGRIIKKNVGLEVATLGFLPLSPDWIPCLCF